MSNKTEEITFYVGPIAKIGRLKSHYESTFTKVKLLELVDPIYPKLSTAKKVVYLNEDGTPAAPPPYFPGMKDAMRLYAYSKFELATFFAYFRSSPKNQAILYGTISEKNYEAFLAIMSYGFLGSEDINDIVGDDVIYQPRSYSSSVEYKPPFNCFKCYIDAKGYAYTDRDNMRYMRFDADSPLMEKALEEVYPLALQPLEQIDTLPADQELEIYSALEYAGSSASILQELISSDQLASSPNKLMPVGALKLAVKALPIPCPTAWQKIPEIKDWLRHIFATIYKNWHLNRKRSAKLTASTEERLRDIFVSLKSFIGYNIQLFQMFLPHIGGINKTMIQSEDYTSAILTLNSLIEESAATSAWANVEQLKQKLYYENILSNENWILRLISPGYYGSSYSSDPTIRNVKQSHPIYPSEQLSDLDWPFVESYIMALAALGMVEVALNVPSEDAPAYINGVRYFRVTELGRYALGLINEINLTSNAAIQEIEVDPDRLIIKLGKGPAIFDSWIQSISQSIGGNRYVVTEERVLSRCSSIKDIKEVKKFFTTNICAKPSPVWERFFDTLETKARSVQQSINEFMIFEINKDDVNLQRLLSSEPRLRGHIRRAEGYLVLIERTYYPLFKQILKEKGYLI